jgi:glutathione peroxidase-family protein
MIFLVSICFVMSCDSRDEVKKDKIGGKEITIEEYKDHTYVVVNSTSKYGITHNPDCKCSKDK